MCFCNAILPYFAVLGGRRARWIKKVAPPPPCLLLMLLIQ